MLPFFNKGKGDKETQKLSRADRKIMEEVERRFYEDKYLKENNIHIVVNDGMVTLDGSVASPLVHDLAEEVALGAPGVKRVQNNLFLGIGRAGEDMTTEQDRPSNDVELADASNTGDPGVHHPTTTSFSEVRSQTRENVTGGTDTGITADEAAQVAIPRTGEGSSVMDAGAVDAMKESGTEVDEDSMEHLLTKGMPVIDRDGRSVGKVKEVRSTDFLLKRLLHRDLYVPYFDCKFDGTHVVLNITADEVNDQGWAFPKPF